MRTMFLSGAISGLVGFIVCSGANNTLYDGVAAGVGLYRHHRGVAGPAQSLCHDRDIRAAGRAGEGADTLQTRMTVPASISDIITGIFLFCMLGCEFFINYQMIFRGKHREEVSGA